jgi:hypothetical protein
VLEDACLDTVKMHFPCSFLFLAETVSVYLTEAQVKTLVLKLHDHFPGAEPVSDAYSPIHVLRSNLQTARFGLCYEETPPNPGCFSPDYRRLRYLILLCRENSNIVRMSLYVFGSTFNIDEEEDNSAGRRINYVFPPARE